MLDIRYVPCHWGLTITATHLVAITGDMLWEWTLCWEECNVIHSNQRQLTDLSDWYHTKFALAVAGTVAGEKLFLAQFPGLTASIRRLWKKYSYPLLWPLFLFLFILYFIGCSFSYYRRWDLWWALPNGTFTSDELIEAIYMLCDAWMSNSDT